MLDNLESLSNPPSKQEFAATFRILGRISFWVQLVLGGISASALLFASFSRNTTVQANNAGIGFGIFLAVIGILILCFRVYWTLRNRSLAKRLQAPTAGVSPKKEDVIQALRVGFIVSFVGILIAFIASEQTVIALLGKALAQPQGVAVYRPENVIRSLDILVILANVNLIGAHFFGGITSLGLLNWLDQ
jgi:Protein of unknown function (DUF3611)